VSCWLHSPCLPQSGGSWLPECATELRLVHVLVALGLSQWSWIITTPQYASVSELVPQLYTGLSLSVCSAPWVRVSIYCHGGWSSDMRCTVNPIITQCSIRQIRYTRLTFSVILTQYTSFLTLNIKTVNTSVAVDVKRCGSMEKLQFDNKLWLCVINCTSAMLIPCLEKGATLFLALTLPIFKILSLEDVAASFWQRNN